jgi:hypothetical protein
MSGLLYTSDEYLDYEDLYCEQCGDSDNYLGKASNKKEVWKLLKPMTDINGSGGYDFKYVKEFINNYLE